MSDAPNGPWSDVLSVRTGMMRHVTGNLPAYRAKTAPATASREIVGAWWHGRGVTIVRYRFRVYLTEGQVQKVALVQACQDARRAHRNWFASLAGRRKGRRVGPPRFRSRKDRRQSVRLTRNGFALRPNGRVHVADGEVVDNPRHLHTAHRRIARAQRELARKQRGSANRRKAAHRVAVLHRRVRETRLDGHHKLALRLVRDNQAVYGHRDGPKPLAVRAWTCEGCGAEHDRDLHAARNVLTEGRRIAAGLAEIENTSLSGRKTGSGPAVWVEAGTRLGTLA